uniref:DUF19 domain-containing protein n=1 Tax=Biomphalaria glabrata TaxID=6526 RepID=A0A2C9LV47_BIOGL
MCRMKDELHSCFNNNTNHCQEKHVQFFVLDSSTINFFCSTEGQQGLQTIADSPCVNKTNIGDSDKCLNIFQSNLQVTYTNSKNNTQGNVPYNPCHYIDQLKVCIEESIKVSCGLAFSTFSRNIINIQYKPLETNYGCTRSARQIHDRDLSHIFPNIGRQKIKQNADG